MKKYSDLKIRTKFILPIILCLLIGGVVGGFLLNRTFTGLIQAQVATTKEMNRLALETSSKNKINEIYNNIERIGRKALEQAAFFSQMPEVVAAYKLAATGNIDDENDPQAQRARELLRDTLRPLINGYKANTGAKELKLHFHLPNARSLVRIWREGWQTQRQGKKIDISDDISSFRKSVVDINRDRRPLSGIEVGRGGFAIRGLSPVTGPDGNHLGSNEVLLSFNDAITASKTDDKNNYAVYMDADLLPIATQLQDPAKNPVLGGKYVFCTTTDKEVTDRFVDVALLDSGHQGSFSKVIGDQYVSAFPIQDYSDKTAGVMVVALDISSQQTMIAKTEEEGLSKLSLLRWWLVVGILILVLLLGGLLTLFVTRIITAPVGKTVAMIKELSKGHLGLRLRMAQKDEIGQMAQTMDEFADSLENEVVASLQKLAAGDLTFVAIPKDEKDLVRGALKNTAEALNSIMAQISAAGGQLASAAGQVSEASQSLSQGSTESASSLEEISSSMTEVGSQTSINAENANQANELAGQTRTAAEKGNRQMGEMVQAMQEISASSQSISKIIKVIDEIAFQTNLLALNAAVEAAHAGQHGKGFAVVAEEVRNLAARSAKAAKETAELIAGSVQKTENGSNIANLTAEALKEIVASVTKAAELAREISSASNEQALAITQINQGLGQIDLVTQQNSATAEESAAAAEELSSQAAELQGMIARFKLASGSAASRSSSPRPAVATAKSGAVRGQQRNLAAPAAVSVKKPSEIIPLDDLEFGKY